MAQHDQTGRLLLLLPKTSYRAQDFLDAADRLGVETAVGSNHRSTLEAFSRGRTVFFNFKTAEKGIAQIIAYAAKYPLRAIVPVDEETTYIAARAAQALGLPHNPPDAVALTLDKYRFRQCQAQAGLPAPAVTRLTIYDDPAAPAAKAAYPVVLKPAALSASQGVIRADDADQFAAAFHRIVQILSHPDLIFTGQGKDQILAEEYIPGDEVALEGLLQGGRLAVLALFDKPDPLQGPYFEETIYVTPSRLAPGVQEAVRLAAEQALTAIGLRDGPVHAELRVNEKAVYVIDVAARTIGGLCARTLSFGAGISLEELVLRHALGLPTGGMDRAAAAAGVMMIPIPRAGELKAVDGLDEARATAGIEDVAITIPVGHHVQPLPEGHRYLGFIFAKAAAPAEAEAALRRAHGELNFRIE